MRPHIAHRTLAFLGRINAGLSRFVQRLVASLLVVMLAIVMAQVAFRYGFNSPISWAEEVSKTLMVWAAFLVAPMAYRDGTNVSIDLFADALPPSLRRVSELVITCLVLWIVIVFLRESIPLVERGMSVSAASVPVPKGIFYAILPVSFSWLALVTMERLLGLCFGPLPSEEQVAAD